MKVMANAGKELATRSNVNGSFCVDHVARIVSRLHSDAML